MSGGRPRAAGLTTPPQKTHRPPPPRRCLPAVGEGPRSRLSLTRPRRSCLASSSSTGGQFTGPRRYHSFFSRPKCAPLPMLPPGGVHPPGRPTEARASETYQQNRSITYETAKRRRNKAAADSATSIQTKKSGRAKHSTAVDRHHRKNRRPAEQRNTKSPEWNWPSLHRRLSGA